ncbi:MAG TPA: adenylate/guanylate cyclase domain-containing protein [Candidatus Saccharimonadales bacterium]|nr:adenylate/guanylate cyclase domain-containing protein [Candidatus Saccharimonadales bacterium]
MVCSSCGTEAIPGSKFCARCGARLTRGCPACGFAIDPADTFCRECGAPLTLASGGASLGTTAPTGLLLNTTPLVSSTADDVVELRVVSVLFADLVGFTVLSESRDPEEVRDLLSRYFDVCRALVERYGGTVEKFIGDAVMAVWGAPLAQEDDAERAVRAALDLVEAVAALGEEVRAPQLAARAGVLTGTAAVNVGARGQGMVAGDLVNTASRIQTQSQPGTVLVGETTRRATDAAVAYEDAGTHQLKGKAEPVPLYRALRVVAGVGGLLKSERLEAPFVGRDRELRLVKEVFHTSTEDKRAHLVQVTGIAGIGKSRLAWEFFKYMDGLQSRYFWHRGRCLAYGQGVTYFALAEMVRGRAGILEAEERDSAIAKLQAVVEQYVPDAEDRRFVLPRLAHLIGLEERTAPDKQDLFAAWRLFFERLAEQSPVLMVFEDMQWADPSLLEFTSYLMEWSRAYPLFVMSLVRPDSPAAGLAATTRNATLIHLEPLSPAAMDTLLTGLVPGLPKPLAERIRGRAEGIPLYAVETVRMLLDRGLLVEEGSAYRPTGQIETLEVPETLHALIAARLDGMSQEERQLAQDASVLGKTFTPQGLTALCGRDEPELKPILASLVAKEVLSVQADPRSPERGQYGFLQDLVRTVAYETLSKRERRSKHLAVAAYLEGAWSAEAEEIVEVLASHYLEAWRLDPDDPGAHEIKSRAREMLVRAAERAAALAAAEEAESAFDRAAELSESSLERAALTERAGEMAELRGRPEQAETRYAEASKLLEEAGQARAAARVQARLAGVEWIRGHIQQAIERMKRAYAGLGGDRPDLDLAVVVAQLGRVLTLQGRYEEAAPLLEEALRLAEHLELPEVYSQALSSKAVFLMDSDRLDEAGLLLGRALDVALDHGLTAAAMRAYNNLGVVLASQDRFAELVLHNEKRHELARRVGDRVMELSSIVAPIGELLVLGRWDEALARAQEARAAEELEGLDWVALSFVGISSLYVRRGELTEAALLIESMQSSAGTSESWERRAGFAVARAEALRAEGRPAEALAAAEEVLADKAELGLGFTDFLVKSALTRAVEAALDLGSLSKAQELLGIAQAALPGQVTPWLRAQIARLSARVRAAEGDHGSVESGFEVAEAGFRELAALFDLAVTLTEHAEWLIDRGRADKARILRNEAREIFEGLRARPWLERLGPRSEEESVPA